MLVQHIDFVFPEEFSGVVELKVILLSVLPGLISDLKEELSSKVLILHYYKTRGRVFSNQRRMMRETQEDYYLVLFTFASKLYFYVLGPISLLGY